MWLCYGEYKGVKKIKPFIKYAESYLYHESELSAFRIYITDSIYYYAREKVLTQRYYELINNDHEDINGDEIALDIIERAGLVVKA